MDSVIRRWWRRIDDLPDHLGQVSRWIQGPGCFSDMQAGSVEEFHPVPTLELCLEGTLRIEKPDQRLDLQPGDALLIAPGVWHRVLPLHAGSLRFSQGFLPRWSILYLQGHDRDWSGRLPIQPSRRLLEQCFAAGDPAVPLVECLRNLGQEQVLEKPFDNPALWRMVHLMWTRARLGLTVEDMVKASGLSRTHAYRLFTASYGIPPKAALASTRLMVAHGLLQTGLPVNEVARRCGFPSADTFRRAWRTWYGRAPSASTRGPGRRAGAIPDWWSARMP